MLLFGIENLAYHKKKKKKKKKRANMALDHSLEFLRLPLSIFLSLSEKNLQKFLYVCTVQIAPIHVYHVY